jgi:hypothetical protein
MRYEDLISTVTSIVNDETIYKEGLVLVYLLNERNHIQMNEELFYKSNPSTAQFEPTEEFEAEIGGILIKFIKKIEE